MTHWEKILDAKITARLQTPLSADEAAAIGLRDLKEYVIPTAPAPARLRPCPTLRLPHTASAPFRARACPSQRAAC